MATETLTTPIGRFDFVLNGYPTPETAQKLFDALDFQRACQAYLAFMPAMSMYSLLEGQETGWGCRACSDLAVSADTLDSTPIVLTGNTESIYFACNVDLGRDGPTVVEIPPQVLGMANDAHFRFIADFGMTGPDRGEGGKYLLLPPNHEGAVPDGHFIARSRTYRVWVMARAGVQTSGTGEQALDWYREHCAVYPLRDGYRKPTVINAGSLPADTTHPNDFRYFANLDRVVQYEPAEAFDVEQLGMLRALGIEKGKPFAPDDRMRTILDTAARTGEGMARAIAYQSREAEAKAYPDRKWEFIFLGGSHEFLANGVRNLDARTLFHFTAIAVTPAMVNKMVGAGSQYLCAYRDGDGDFLDGGRSYSLRLPPDIPVNNFWSVTLYDPGTRSLLQNGTPKPSVNSFDAPVRNADGSFDIHFGPEAPDGRERNWVRTVPGKGWFTYIRLYGPLEPFFDHSWKPDDIVKVA